MVPTTYQCVHILFTHWYVVGAIFYSHIDTWWVPYFIHTLMHGGYHILFTHWYMVGTIFYSHIDTWWVSYFIHTLIHGGCHILFTHWYMGGAIFINMWIKYGTHHVSMCEQNMVPTTYQYVNKIWHPPCINVWIKYGTHHLVPTLIHDGCHILFTYWYMVGAIFCSHIDRGGYHILFTHW
jgi:hypothetical protein